ncbi:MAG: DNA-3-methyladenine glycosylase 2 family protein [Candidatus Chisholmbacteria bacterium]|nr:DNA-3-methyladenine glycosylase 2 family protein [Candidatus Chisholmbacteria bacterium]
MNTYSINYSLKDITPPLNWYYYLTHYVFEPWRREGNSLVRLFKFPSGKLGLVKVNFSGTTQKPQANLTIHSHQKLSPTDQTWIKDLISWCFDFHTDVSEFYDQICQKDPVLKAASEELYGAKLRTDPDVFESVIGVVMAQNVQFQRIYTMLKLLCHHFGDHQDYHGQTYFTFPAPQILAHTPLAKIRACKVGYRDKYIQGIAEYIIKNKIDLNKLRQIKDTNNIRQELIKLPGVGPYTADLTLAIGFRRPSFHLDLFSREAMYTFYFKGKKVSDPKITNFVNNRWGKWKHHAMLLLTTNTDEWAQKLGLTFRLKSGAKSHHTPGV